jgi:hypothetical protein
LAASLLLLLAPVSRAVEGLCSSPTWSGTPFNDVYNGTTANDVIAGLGGDDIIIGNGGNDVICGGPGNDSIDGGADQDRIWGEDGNDLVSGDDGNDYFDGGAGNDRIEGGAGNDPSNGQFIHGGEPVVGVDEDPAIPSLVAPPRDLLDALQVLSLVDVLRLRAGREDLYGRRAVAVHRLHPPSI